jgi:hypothetical protein
MFKTLVGLNHFHLFSTKKDNKIIRICTNKLETLISFLNVVKCKEADLNEGTAHFIILMRN